LDDAFDLFFKKITIAVVVTVCCTVGDTDDTSTTTLLVLLPSLLVDCFVFEIYLAVVLKLIANDNATSNTVCVPPFNG